MRRFFPLVLVFLLGCSGTDPAVEAALELRGRILAARQVSFGAEVLADYTDRVEECDLDCAFDPEGGMTFTVMEPEEVSGITGTVAGTEGTVQFDTAVLAFPLMAQGRLSPLSAPWVVMKALRSGCIVSAVREGELLHLTIDDSYGSDALTVDLWLEEGIPEQAEISWEGRRQVVLELDDFAVST